MLDHKLPSYLLFNTEPEHDCWDGQLALDALQSALCVVCMTPYRSQAMEQYADVLLPIAIYAENEGSYFNIEGNEQVFSCVVPPPGEARPGWKVLRVLADCLGVTGVAYNALDELRYEVTRLIGTVQPVNLNAWLAPEALPSPQNRLFRISELPMNSLDPLVRRAHALQSTTDVADGTVHLSSATAGALGLTPGSGVRVKQDGFEGDFPLTIDERLPRNTILIQAAYHGDRPIGPWVGEVQVEPR